MSDASLWKNLKSVSHQPWMNEFVLKGKKIGENVETGGGWEVIVRELTLTLQQWETYWETQITAVAIWDAYYERFSLSLFLSPSLSPAHPHLLSVSIHSFLLFSPPPLLVTNPLCVWLSDCHMWTRLMPFIHILSVCLLRLAWLLIFNTWLVAQKSSWLVGGSVFTHF